MSERRAGLETGNVKGAPISPLLSNLCMRRFVLGWKALGQEQRLDAHIVNDADDVVICCRGTADEALSAMRQIMDKLRLTALPGGPRDDQPPLDPVAAGPCCRWILLPVEDRVAQIHRKLVGWSHDFCLGPVSKACRTVDRHVCGRLRP